MRWFEFPAGRANPPSCRDSTLSGSGEQPLDELVRAVLRSTLEQPRSRQAALPDS
jgi:hypothetical protein